ncbi:hypothetical protein MASR2M15_22460 [Anaerolineales bacterium]
MKKVFWIIPITLILVLFSFSINLTVIVAQTYGSNWLGQYYNTSDFSGTPVLSRTDQTINFNWGAGSPDGAVTASSFSVIWTSTQNFAAGTYTFYGGSDGGIQFYLDNVLILDNINNASGFQTVTASTTVTEGAHTLQVRYRKTTTTASVQFYWTGASITGPSATVVPTAYPTQTPLPPIPAGALRATVINAHRLNIRDVPSLGGMVLDKILRGQTYAVIGRDAKARWFLLQLSGKTGWAWGYYLFIDGNEFNAPIASSNVELVPPGVSDTGTQVQVRQGMKLRSAPTENSEWIGRIPWGAFLPVVGRDGSGAWLQVVWKGTVGWMYSGYAKTVSGDLANVPYTAP